MRFIDRDGERGSAMTEGVIVATFLIILFAATLFVFRAYRLHVWTLRSPAREVWPDALQGCADGARANRILGYLGGYESVAERVTPDIASRYDRVVVTEFDETDTRTMSEGNLLGGESVTFRERAKVACNASGTYPLVNWRKAATDLFCRLHVGPQWPAGCTLSTDPSGSPEPGGPPS